MIYVKLIKLWEICPRNEMKNCEEKSISNEKRIYSDIMVKERKKIRIIYIKETYKRKVYNY